MKDPKQEKDIKIPLTELELEIHISKLDQRRNELQLRFPAHSIPPNLIVELDELDEEIELLKSRLDLIHKERDNLPDK
jgi:hypothetical protein